MVFELSVLCLIKRYRIHSFEPRTDENQCARNDEVVSRWTYGRGWGGKREPSSNKYKKYHRRQPRVHARHDEIIDYGQPSAGSIFRREIESVRKPVPLEDKKKKKKEHRKRSEIYERGESLKFRIKKYPKGGRLGPRRALRSSVVLNSHRTSNMVDFDET